MTAIQPYDVFRVIYFQRSSRANRLGDRVEISLVSRRRVRAFEFAPRSFRRYVRWYRFFVRITFILT